MGAFQATLERRGIHYAWVIAAVSFLTLITAAGFRSTTGVLIVPLQDEFGWSRGDDCRVRRNQPRPLRARRSVRSRSIRPIGVRRVIAGALLVVAASSALTTRMGSPWQLDVLWGVANGLATGAIGVTLAAVIATRWFVRRRGLVTGMLTASNATGQLVFLPLLGGSCRPTGGGRRRWTVSTVALIVVLPLVLLLLRDRPSDVGLRPFGGGGGRSARHRGKPLRRGCEGTRGARRAREPSGC